MRMYIFQYGPTKQGRLFIVLLSAWPLVLLTPLVPFPAPSILVGHPWKPELLLSLLLGALTTVSLLRLWRNREDGQVIFSIRKLFPVVLPLVLFICWSGISLIWAGSGSSVLHHTLVWSGYLGFFLVSSYIVINRPLFGSVIYVLGAVILVITINCTLEHILRERIDATFGFRYGRYAEIWAALLPLFITFAMRSKGKRLALALTVSSLMWLAILFSTSRGSLAASIVGMAAFGGLSLIANRSRFGFRRFLLIAGWLFLLGVLTQLPAIISPNQDKQSTLDRLVTSSETDPGNSLSRNIRFLFLATGLEMWRSNPVTGVGADNFGLEFNNYRTVISTFRENRSLVLGSEDAIPERAHNEYLQIVSELGVVGGFVFIGFLIGILYLGYGAIFKQAPNSNPIVVHAAVAGMIAFLVSSGYSSFSFRLVQNGLVFFFLLALLLANKIKRNYELSENSSFNTRWRAGILSIGLILSAGLAVFSLLKASSQYLTYIAEQTGDPGAADGTLKTAIQIDPANAAAHYTYASMLLNTSGYSGAATQYREAIRKGLGTSTTYSYLISAHSLAGEDPAALEAASEAISVYPYSVFLLTRFSVLLELSGRTREAEVQFNLARNLDPKQADTWRLLIKEGSKKAAEAGRSGLGVPLLIDLYPADGVYAVLAERQIRFPEERYKFPPQ